MIIFELFEVLAVLSQYSLTVHTQLIRVLSWYTEIASTEPFLLDDRQG